MCIRDGHNNDKQTISFYKGKLTNVLFRRLVLKSNTNVDGQWLPCSDPWDWPCFKKTTVDRPAVSMSWPLRSSCQQVFFQLCVFSSFLHLATIYSSCVRSCWCRISLVVLLEQAVIFNPHVIKIQQKSQVLHNFYFHVCVWLTRAGRSSSRTVQQWKKRETILATPSKLMTKYF